MVLKKIRKIISEHTAVDESGIELDTDLADDLQLDSLDAFEIMSAVEDEFDIEVEDDFLDKIKTVADIVNYIEKLTGEEE